MTHDEMKTYSDYVAKAEFLILRGYVAGTVDQIMDLLIKADQQKTQQKKAS